MPKSSGGGGNGGRSGGGGGGSGASDATQVRYDLDEMESGTRYANRNLPGATMLSEREMRDLERMGKPERIKSKQERTRERQAAAKREEARNPDKSAFKFPANPKKGDIAKNGYGATREWTGTFWR